MSLPLSVLNNMLHPSEDYHNPKDVEKIAKLTNQLKKLEEVIERYTKNENKIPSEQDLEGVSTQNTRKTKRDRSYNKKQAEEDGKSTSLESRRF